MIVSSPKIIISSATPAGSIHWIPLPGKIVRAAWFSLLAPCPGYGRIETVPGSEFSHQNSSPPAGDPVRADEVIIDYEGVSNDAAIRVYADVE